MQPGDVLFVRTTGIIGALIRWLTRSEVNHVALAVDEERILEVQPGTGVRIIKNPYKRYTRARLRRALTSAEQTIIVKVARLLAGQPYDWSLVGALLFRIFGWKTWLFRNCPTRWICTEAVDYAYLVAGIDLLPHRGLDVTPEELMRSELFELQEVDEGRGARAGTKGLGRAG